jgi:hypothetical protein
MNVEEIMQCKTIYDSSLRKQFEKKFNHILTKFDSLSKNSQYKKIQKVSFIKQTNDKDKEDNILVMMNKLTPSNFATISEKLVIQVSNQNILSFISQILSYSSKLEINTEYLWILIVNLCSGLVLSQENMSAIEDQLQTYIDDFIKTFDIHKKNDLSHEEYSDFVNRLKENKEIISKLNLIICMLQSSKLNFFKRKLDINCLLLILMDRLIQIINNNVNENLCFVLLECILVLIPHETLKKNPFTYKKFKNTFDASVYVSKLNNKNRFKLMDILDYINLHIR